MSDPRRRRPHWIQPPPYEYYPYWYWPQLHEEKKGERYFVVLMVPALLLLIGVGVFFALLLIFGK